MILIGWDISTSIIGICAMELESGRTLAYHALRVEGETMMRKYDSATAQAASVIEGILGAAKDPIHHFVEDRLGNFSAGKTMLQTLMKLAQMNAVMSWHIESWGPVTHIHPSTAKRLAGLKVPKGADKKLEAIKLVRSVDSAFPYKVTKAGNPAAGIADMADAWLLVTAGRKLLRGEATLGEGKEAAGGHGPIGPADP